MVHSYPRANRLSKVILETIADEVERLKDPRLELVTITGVDVGADLTLATVFFASGGDESRLDECRAGLEAASHRLRRALATQLRLKRVPALRFAPDPAIIAGSRVDEVIRGIESDAVTPGSDAVEVAGREAAGRAEEARDASRVEGSGDGG